MSWLLLCALALAKPITVPVDVGVGPAGHFFTGPIQNDQIVHTGLKLSIQAIIDQKTIRKNKHRIPKQYREMAMQMEEVRISPSIFIPDTLWISPPVLNTQMYGISWRPIGISLPFVTDPVRFVLNGGLRLTYIFIHSTTLESPTHFIRPGASFQADLEIPFSKSFLISLNWDSHVYIPQEVGGFGLAPINESIWHIGQASLMFHYRFPYTVNL